MSRETLFSNARIVLRHEIIHGSLLVRDGEIAAIDPGPSRLGEDLQGDYLLPGLVELHTDHLEAHYSPRPGVRWDMTAAIQAHDAQIATAGITTVFDCLRMGSDESNGFRTGEMRAMADALAEAAAQGRLRAEHFLHLRCEVSSPDMLDHFEAFREDDAVRLISLMDHAPGQRQFQTMEQYTLYYKKKAGLSDAEFAAFVEKRLHDSATHSARHRAVLAEHARQNGISVASHDDATEAHVEESISLGVALAEFPTSLEAAEASHKAGLSVLMGAPNIVRGKSHSGNIAARDLAAAGVLDVLSSDYVPASLLHAAFTLPALDIGVSLPEAIALVSATPAKTVGLADRGEIAAGKKADLLRVEQLGSIPLIKAVYRDGERRA